jgi:hypothetical protein
MADIFDVIYDDFALFTEVRDEAEPLANDLKDRIDTFTAELIEKYERDGSFKDGLRDAGDVAAPAMAAVVIALAHTICAWQESEARTRELQVAIEWLNELVTREPLPDDARSVIESYKRSHE